MRNVLNTLYLPYGSTNRYRYTLGQNLHSESFKNFEKKINQEVTIIFINRFGKNGYEYYPLRNGKLVDLIESAPLVHFIVELKAHLSPESQQSLQKKIESELRSSDIPSLKNSDPLCESDGQYAINSNSCITSTGNWLFEEKAWFTNAERLSQCKAFISKQAGGLLEKVDTAVFLHSSFVIGGKKISGKNIRTINSTNLHKIKSGKSVFLRIKYLVRNGGKQKFNNQELFFSANDALNITYGSSCPLSSLTDIHDVGLDVMTDAIGKSGEILVSNKSEKELLLPDSGIRFLSVRPKSFWVTFVLLLIMWALPGWASDPLLIDGSWLLDEIPSWKSFIAIAGPIVSACALFFLLKHTQKNFL